MSVMPVERNARVGDSDLDIGIRVTAGCVTKGDLLLNYRCGSGSCWWYACLVLCCNTELSELGIARPVDRDGECVRRANRCRGFALVLLDCEANRNQIGVVARPNRHGFVLGIRERKRCCARPCNTSRCACQLHCPSCGRCRSYEHEARHQTYCCDCCVESLHFPFPFLCVRYSSSA